ncbi:MAG: hydantoinase/oxoprolinase family protein [Methanohalobium sp.]|uniref:hydantoinase/oxoprolinase family protein n=1 Tax=Methanohalobium sp. TaxID=2837493 RepID=UPI00397BB016
MDLGLGVDTGGTYTDTIIMDISNGNVLDSNKSLTTYPELITGIKNAIDGLNSEYLKDVKFVSVSTTLATNSILENKGRPAGLILIGYSIPKKLSTDVVISLSGGHDANGDEIEPLDDFDTIKEFILKNKDRVSSFAISSYFGVRNPEHENQVKEMVQNLTDLPVVCGHELSQDLGAYERSVTALLNAQLIPETSQFIKSIHSVMNEKNINATLMMMKCDGSLIKIEEALKKPVETIFSGPAASLVGASHLTNLDTCATVDVGGTSTDVSFMSNGIPEISDTGAVVGGWKTMVKAISMDTSAMGGDSHVWIQKKSFIGPKRVVPLCQAASKYPQIIDKLETNKKISKRIMDDVIQPTAFFMVNGYDKTGFYDLGDYEKKVIDVIVESDVPLSILDVSEKLQDHPLMFSNTLRLLEQKKYINQIGFTPTDALHVLNDYNRWDTKAARIGAELLANQINMNPGSFSSYIKEEVVRTISLNLVDFFADDVDKSDINKLLNKSGYLKMKMNLPVVLIGASVKAYLNDLNTFLDAGFIAPEYSEVGNAVGALMGDVIYRTETSIKPYKTGSSKYVVFSETGRNIFETYEEAKDYAIDFTERLVFEYMRSYNLDKNSVQFNLDKNEIGKRMGTPIETKLVGIGVGKPINKVTGKNYDRECNLKTRTQVPGSS